MRKPHRHIALPFRDHLEGVALLDLCEGDGGIAVWAKAMAGIEETTLRLAARAPVYRHEACVHLGLLINQKIMIINTPDGPENYDNTPDEQVKIIFKNN